MPHLVSDFYNTPILQAILWLTEAHDFLAEHAKQTLPRLQALDSVAQWGQQVKRELVKLEGAHLVHISIEHQSFAEVVNQCATLERLLDGLRWARENLEGYNTVEVCHPTTSNHTGKLRAENDLVLLAADGSRCRFEISDVASESDGNRKERKDLQSLGVFTGLTGPCYAETWPVCVRLFLVVSKEFSQRLMKTNRHGLKPEHLQYEMKEYGTTRVIEVKKGPKWDERII